MNDYYAPTNDLEVLYNIEFEEAVRFDTRQKKRCYERDYITGKVSDDPIHIFDFYEISNVDLVSL